MIVHAVMLQLPTRGVACSSMVVGQVVHPSSCYIGASELGINLFLVQECFYIATQLEQLCVLFKNPFAVVFRMTMRLAVLTASSARPFDCGSATDDSRCLTPHVLKNSERHWT